MLHMTPPFTSDGTHLCCLGAFAPLTYVILHGLTIREGTKSFSGDVRMVHKQISAAVLRRNESKSLLFIKPFNRTFCHNTVL